MVTLTEIAVVLGRGPGGPTLASAQKAAELWFAGLVDYILLSGKCSVFADVEPDFTEATEMLELILSMTSPLGAKVPRDRILLDEWARDTISNMVGSARILRKKGITRAHLKIVVTPRGERRARYAGELVFDPRSFEIEVVTSDYVYPSPEEEAKTIRDEQKYYWATRLILLFVRRGNLRAIQRRLQWLGHPGYRTWLQRVKQPIKLV